MIRVTLLAAALLPGLASADPLPSGTSLLSETLQTQQRDPDANPGMLWVAEGARLWDTAAADGPACAACHDRAEISMRGVATRYPQVAADGVLLNLEGRINRCRIDNQRAAPWDYESGPLLAMTAHVARQSLGLPMDVRIDGPAAVHYERGEVLFQQRQGQLNLSCAQCHDDNAGRRLRGDTISYGLGNGFPIYRLEWQSLGSLHRRLRACSLGVRAVQFDFGSAEYLDLELYLARRATGVAIETPAIRR
ncbi:MAG: sulfur oxidation c-type cytochrome SoxA [Pseudomonadales bacterium]